MTDQSTADETQLLGAVLAMTSPQEVQTVLDDVPAACFTDPLDQAIYTAAARMVTAGVWDPAGLARAVIEGGLWPRQLHGEVTGRIVDRIVGCLWPAAWRSHAAAVLDNHTRRTIAEKVVGLSHTLQTADLREVARELHNAAEYADNGHARLLDISTTKAAAHA